MEGPNLTQHEVIKFLTLKGGRCTNFELVSNFRGALNHPQHQGRSILVRYFTASAIDLQVSALGLNARQTVATYDGSKAVHFAQGSRTLLVIYESRGLGGEGGVPSWEKVSEVEFNI